MHHSNAAFVDDEKSNDSSGITLKSVINVSDEDAVAPMDSPKMSSGWKVKLDGYGVNRTADKLNARGEAKVSVVSMGDSSSGVSSEQDEEEVNAETSVENVGDKETVAILGSGDFGRALASRLVQSGYNVIIGSRDPQRNS